MDRPRKNGKICVFSLCFSIKILLACASLGVKKKTDRRNSEESGNAGGARS